MTELVEREGESDAKDSGAPAGADFEPPRLTVIGTAQELTRGVPKPGSAPDAGGFASLP